ncbi:MAG: TolC family protein [Burkholderiaceae bacterium]
MSEPETNSPWLPKPFGQWRISLLILGAISLTGCASFSEDGGFGVVQQTTAERLGKDVRWARTMQDRNEIAERVTDLLARPLTIDNAVQVALLNNRGLQATFDSLGITEAERVQAGRLPNPGFSFGKNKRGDEREIERGFHVNLARLIFMPTILKLETRRLEQAQGDVAMRVLDLAAQTRKAWVEAVSGRESALYMNKVKRTADVGAQLARRMAKVGNFSKLQQAREQSFYAEATLNQARAENAALAARERLTRLLGLYGDQARYELPERLPSLPETPEQYPNAVKIALAQRLDVQAAKTGVERLAGNLGMVKTNRFINVLELGSLYNTSNEEPKQTGWEIELELPIFDWGDAKVARADAMYRQAMNQAAQTAIDARSEVRQAYAGYRSAFDIAAHYRDEIVPLSKRISEENLYRYNGMMIGVFELLADARAQIGAVDGYIEALKDFWMAKTDLDMAMIGKPSLTAMPGAQMSADTGGADH